MSDVHYVVLFVGIAVLVFIAIAIAIAITIRFGMENARLTRVADERVIAFNIENRRLDREMKAEIMEMLKPMNAIVARIHETTETYFRDDGNGQ